MDVLEIMKARHSVLQYSGKKIENRMREASAAWRIILRLLGKRGLVWMKKLACIIAFGYGDTQGAAHKNKPVEQLCNCASGMPDWFSKGMEAALLAPTAMNQQKFYTTLEGERVFARAGKGFCTKPDPGIVKYHFEAAAGRKVE